MSFKKKIAVLSSVLGVTTVVSPIICTEMITRINNVSLTNNLSSNINTKAQGNYYETQPNLENIATASGPMVLKTESTMTHLDWWGTEMWSVDVKNIDENSTKIVDYDYLPSKDWLFLLTDQSYLIKVNTKDGTILGKASSGESEIPSGANRIVGIEFNKSLYAWNTNDTNGKVVVIERNKLTKEQEININNESNTNEEKKTLVDIYPMAVGYNVGLFGKGNINDQTPVSELQLRFIDDNIKEIGTLSGNELINLVGGKKVSDIASYSFIRGSNAQTNIIIIDDELFTVSLNKTDMTKSEIKKVDYSSFTLSEQPSDRINSAFVDEFDNLFFKTYGSKKVYKFDFNDKLQEHMDLSTTRNRELTVEANKTDNNIQIFPVLSQDKSKNINNHMVFINPKSELIVGSKNSFTTDEANFTQAKSTISPKSNSKLTTKLPSQAESSDFELRAVEQTRLEEGKNFKLTANDFDGSLIAKANVKRKAWYDNATLLDTIVTYDSKKSSINPIKLSNNVSWIAKDRFKTEFSKYTANQITEKDLNSRENIIVFKNRDSNPSYFKNYTEKIAIKSRENENGKISLSGVISYTDRHNNYINYSLTDQTFDLQKRDNGKNYKIKFDGATSEHPGQKNGQDHPENISAIQISQVKNQKLKNLSNYVPSLIDPNLFPEFIEVEDGYIPSRRTIFRSNYNDTEGTLEITLLYNGMAPTIPFKFIQKYTGFATETDASIDFKGDEAKSEEDLSIISQFKSHDNSNDYLKDKEPKKLSTIQGYKEYENLVADEVKANALGNVYETKLSKMGFQPTLKIVDLQTVDYEFGSVILELDYKGGKTDPKKLKEPYYQSFGLKDGIARQRYFGMLPIGARYNIAVDKEKSNEIINKYNVDSIIPQSELIESLELKGFNTDEVKINHFKWDGEKLVFTVNGQSKVYKTVSQNKTLVIDWAPKFMGIRTRNTIIAVSVAVIGVAIVSTAVTLYILNRNRIRRLLK